MLGSQLLVECFGRTVGLVEMQTRGLAHADSLRQPAVRGNCMNWVLGHLLNNRNSVLMALGLEPVRADLQARYQSESEPVTPDDDGAARLDDLLDGLRITQARLGERLARLDPAALQAPATLNDWAAPLDEVLLFLYFHETYHVGQLELLRQLAGTNDKVI